MLKIKKMTYFLTSMAFFTYMNTAGYVNANEGERFLELGEGQKVRIIEDKISDHDAKRVIEYCRYLIEREGAEEEISDLLDKVTEFNSNTNIIADAWYFKLEAIYQLPKSGLTLGFYKWVDFFKVVSKLANLYSKSDVSKKGGKLFRTLENIIITEAEKKSPDFWLITGIYQFYRDLMPVLYMDKCKQIIERRMIDLNLSEAGETVSISRTNGHLNLMPNVFSIGNVDGLYKIWEGVYGSDEAVRKKKWVEETRKLNENGYYGEQANYFIDNYVDYDESRLVSKKGMASFKLKKGITLRKIIKEFCPSFSGHEFSWLKEGLTKRNVFE